MSEPQRSGVLVLGSGEGGKYLAWQLAKSGRQTAVVERKWIGGSCANINCLPSRPLTPKRRLSIFRRP
jgi:pyruvate/2-oxoglutarate dehydrogenase complex dihydrolipoamide dehydrogenase (E3) component